MSSGSRVSYVYYSLSTLKVEQDYVFPAEAQALLGRNDYPVTLHNCQEVETCCAVSVSNLVMVLTVVAPWSRLLQ